MENKINLSKFVDWVNADNEIPENIIEEEVHLNELNEVEDIEEEVNQEIDEELDFTERDEENQKKKRIHQKIKDSKRLYNTIVFLMALIIIVVLIIMVLQLPVFGSINNPTINTVYERYTQDGLKDTGAINLVTGMILEYRAFDTLGETFVLFTAIMAVISLLRNPSREKPVPLSLNDNYGRSELIEPIDLTKESIVLRKIVKILFPFILIFGIYIVLNGHLSPGGGFAGGAIIGASIILYAISYHTKRVRQFLDFKRFTIINSAALLFYVFAKGYSFLMGANHLPTNIPLGTPGTILSGGLILPLNICVGIVVACTIYGIYALFSEGEV